MTLPDRLKELLSELNGLPGQIEQEVQTLVATLPREQPPPEPSPPTSFEPESVNGTDVAAANAQLAGVDEQIKIATEKQAKLQAKNDELAEDLGRWEQDIERAVVQRNDLNAQCEQALAHLQGCEEKCRELNLRVEQLQAFLAQAESVQQNLEAREARLAEAEAKLSEREKSVEDLASHLEKTRYWLESLLPAWLSEENVAPWRDAILDDAKHARDASTAAGLLFATLSLYTYAQRDTDPRAIADALRDVGRRLFGWLKERGYGDHESSGVGQLFADNINRECAGRCEVEVPFPGSPAQNQTMLYQPRPGVSAQSVATVQSWCVRGAKREVIHRAAVTV